MQKDVMIILISLIVIPFSVAAANKASTDTNVTQCDYSRWNNAFYQQISSRLDLSNKKISAIPPEIGMLTQVTELRLTDNELTTLPSEIGMLNRLEKLYLHCNKLTTLPPEIGMLNRYLQELHLAYNKFIIIPAAIGNITRLRKLDLSRNHIQSIDVQLIAGLSSLRHIDLSQNPLKDNDVQELREATQGAIVPPEIIAEDLGDEHLPPGINIERTDGNNKASTDEDVTQHDYSHWNKALYQQIDWTGYLSGSILNLSKKKISAIPPEIGWLKRLEKLYLYCNKLTTLPSVIGLLNHLQELHLAYNKFIIIPAAIGNITHLRKLDLSHNHIQSIDVQLIAGLSSLRHIDLSQNPLKENDVQELRKATQGAIMPLEIIAEDLGDEHLPPGINIERTDSNNKD